SPGSDRRRQQPRLPLGIARPLLRAAPLAGRQRCSRRPRTEPRAKADGLFPKAVVAVDASGHFLGTTGGTSLDGGNYVLRFDPLPRGQSSQSKLTLFI